MHGIEKGRPGRAGDAVIVTGSGTGLGLETALHLASRGFRVFATVRKGDQIADVQAAATQRGVSLDVLQLDITDPVSIERGIAAVLEQAGAIYGLVNNAGVGLRGSTEDCSEAEIRHLFDTNVIGTIAVTKAVIPAMRAAGCGRIITVSSVGGRICGFGVTMYCASKFAQEGLGEGLAQELAPFGIQSVIVEPGIIKTTRWSVNRGTAARASDPDSPYHDLFGAGEALAQKRVETSPTRPEDVARTIGEALTAEQPRMRYVVGRGAKVAIALRRYMPQSLFERLYFAGGIRRIEQRASEGGASPGAEPAP
ncbi:MAG TPA: SDR family oxidoreductase [Solirubrobacteraceae bacterium]|nr:SDR family oxidoreductase [Solirubrobacteraceae bacterium]